MTTVAWDENTIASDSRVSLTSEMILNNNTTKIFKLKNGGVMGFAGGIAIALAFRKWFDGEGDAPDLADPYNCIYIDNKYRCWAYDGTAKVALRTEKRGAIGTGAKFAYAILDYGGTAEEAVRAGIKRDIWSGGKIKIIRYRD
jgi:ATP-dependent protease HslVU (ClpYQ) peptidase subunit